MAGPILIGGLGGSGTRVLAKILTFNNVFLGNDLNNSLDYLIFSRLFIRPQWLKNASNSHIKNRLKLITDFTLGKHIKEQDWQQFIELNIRYPRFNISKTILEKKFQENKNRNSSAWGWKEPNTHIYIEYLLSYYQGLKFIYVVRNGLDMVLSKNKQQLANWGSHFQIPKEGILSQEHRQALFWLKSNDRIKSLKAQKASDKILILDYDNLCTDTEKEVEKLFKFLDIELTENTFTDLESFISPSSRNRHLNQSQMNIPERLKTQVLSYTF